MSCTAQLKGKYSDKRGAAGMTGPAQGAPPIDRQTTEGKLAILFGDRAIVMFPDEGVVTCVQGLRCVPGIAQGAFSGQVEIHPDTGYSKTTFPEVRTVDGDTKCVVLGTPPYMDAKADIGPSEIREMMGRGIWGQLQSVPPESIDSPVLAVVVKNMAHTLHEIMSETEQSMGNSTGDTQSTPKQAQVTTDDVWQYICAEGIDAAITDINVSAIESATLRKQWERARFLASTLDRLAVNL